MILDWLADTLRATGYPTVEEGDWRNRSAGGFHEVRGVLMHHTAGGPAPHSSRRVVIEGRPGLPGPLCNVYICRVPEFHVVGGQRANHAGRGQVPGVPTDQGNAYLVGFECENTGTGEPWDNLYPIMVAGAGAVLQRAGLGSGASWDHKEYTARKIDRYGIDPNSFRASVAGWMTGGGEDDFMSALTDEQQRVLYGWVEALAASGVANGRVGVTRYNGESHMFWVAQNGTLVHRWYDATNGWQLDYPTDGMDPDAGIAVCPSVPPVNLLAAYGFTRDGDVKFAQWNPVAGRWESDTLAPT